jgi:hypothetical protein
MIFGEVLAKISLVSISNQTNFVVIYQVKTDIIILIPNALKGILKKFFSPLAIANHIPFIGLKNGAISMAQITTATEF